MKIKISWKPKRKYKNYKMKYRIVVKCKILLGNLWSVRRVRKRKKLKSKLINIFNRKLMKD